MSRDGVAAGGYKTIGQIVSTNDLAFQSEQNAEDVAIELLSHHVSGAPVVTKENRLVGFISEFDILRAYEARKDLRNLTAGDIMSRNPVTVHATTSLSEAIRIMSENHWLTLPVEDNGIVKYSVTRHDLLRAYTGIGLGTET